MNLKFILALILIISLSSCKSSKVTTDTSLTEPTAKLSSITNKTPYDPKPGMQKLRDENEIHNANGKIKLKKRMHFLVFGDSKGSEYMQDVLKIADQLNPQFCITTADLVNKGAGKIGIELYKDLDKESGWFFRKYPTWPSLGNHEVSGSKEFSGEENYDLGVENFGDFFGLKDPLYSFTYGDAKFIALDWIKVSESEERLKWLENELKEAQGKRIFIFKHRPYYTVGSKSYNDVEGKNTVATELFTKYKVTAVFSGHDHIYYRTLRDDVNYIVSAGAGASIYQLKREKDAIAGDSYYGREIDNDEQFRFRPSKGKDISFNKAMYYVLSVTVFKNKVVFKMIDTNGKTWDKYTFK